MSDPTHALAAGEAVERVIERGEATETVAADAGVDPATVHRAIARGYERTGNGAVSGRRRRRCRRRRPYRPRRLRGRVRGPSS